MEHLLHQMPCQLDWCHKKSNGWAFWSKREDDEFNYQRTIFPVMGVCLDTLIPIDMYNEGLLGPPGLPEFNPDVGSYSAGEFPLLESAIRLGIRDQQCLGVFEIASIEPSLISRLPMQLPGVRVASGQELGQRMLVEVVKVSPSDELDSFEIGQPLPSVQSLQDGGETTEIDSSCQESNFQNWENNVATPLFVDDHIEFEKDRGQVMQPDSHFEQPCVEIDSTGNARSNDKLEHNDIAECLPVVKAEATNEDSNFIIGATTNNEKIHSQKNNEIQRIEKDYQITRDILEQQFGLTPEDAAKNLRVSRATLKRICREYDISRWPHHKTRKVYHNFSQGISLQGAEPYMGDQQCPNLSQEKGTNCSVQKKSRSTGKPCDDSVMSIKVTYRDDIIKFKLTPSSTMVEPEGGVEKRLNISLQIFPIKYQDEDEDWVTITGDSDLREGMHEIRLLGRTAMKLVVTPKSDT